MSCRSLENGLGGGVVDGDFDADLGDLDVAHHAVSGEVQTGKVTFVFFGGKRRGGEGVRKDVGEEGVVIAMGLSPLGVVVDGSGGFGLGDGLVVGGDEAALAVVVPLVGDEGVQQQGQTG